MKIYMPYINDFPFELQDILDIKVYGNDMNAIIVFNGKRYTYEYYEVVQNNGRFKYGKSY